MYHELRNDANIKFSSGVKVAAFVRSVSRPKVSEAEKKKIENNNEK